MSAQALFLIGGWDDIAGQASDEVGVGRMQQVLGEPRMPQM